MTERMTDKRWKDIQTMRGTDWRNTVVRVSELACVADDLYDEADRQREELKGKDVLIARYEQACRECGHRPFKEPKEGGLSVDDPEDIADSAIKETPTHVRCRPMGFTSFDKCIGTPQCVVCPFAPKKAPAKECLKRGISVCDDRTPDNKCKCPRRDTPDGCRFYTPPKKDPFVLSDEAVKRMKGTKFKTDEELDEKVSKNS